MNILIIEDDKYFASHLKKALVMNDIVHRVDIVDCFCAFMGVFSNLEWYDIILTDLWFTEEALREFDGFYVIRAIREASIRIPIIVISGRNDISKIQSAFKLWANDYIVKGTRMKELEVRVMHWFQYFHLEKLNSDGGVVYEYKNLCFNLEKNEFLMESTPIPLTRSNKRVLSVFFMQPEELLPESYLISKLWWDVSLEIDRNIRIHISRLRTALNPFGIDTWIQNIHSEGYIFSAEEA